MRASTNAGKMAAREHYLRERQNVWRPDVPAPWNLCRTLLPRRYEPAVRLYADAAAGTSGQATLALRDSDGRAIAAGLGRVSQRRCAAICVLRHNLCKICEILVWRVRFSAATRISLTQLQLLHLATSSLKFTILVVIRFVRIGSWSTYDYVFPLSPSCFDFKKDIL